VISWRSTDSTRQHCDKLQANHCKTEIKKQISQNKLKNVPHYSSRNKLSGSSKIPNSAAKLVTILQNNMYRQMALAFIYSLITS
jgi:hypothetical protein